MGDQRQRNSSLLDPYENYSYQFRNPVRVILMSVWLAIIALPLILMSTLRWIFKRKKSIRGKICLVTGAGRGLGRGLALQMANEGAHLICVDVDETSNDETVKMIKKKGGFAEGFTVNVANYQEVDRLASLCPRVDILVNNAALIMVHTIDQWDPKEVAACFNVNVLGAYWTIRAFLPGMRRRRSGHIVNISSISALSTGPLLTIYAVTKAALSHLSFLLREELEDMSEGKNIKVTCIHPYVINTSGDYTDMFDCRLRAMTQEDGVKGIMNSILYEEGDCSLHFGLYIFMRLTRMMPRFWRKQLSNMFGLIVRSRSQEYRHSLPYYKIVETSQDPTR